MYILILLDEKLEKYNLENNNPPGIDLIFKTLEYHNINYFPVNYEKIEIKNDEFKINNKIHPLPDFVFSLIIPLPENTYFKKVKEYFEDKTNYINKYTSSKLVKDKYATIQYINKNLNEIKTIKTFKINEFSSNNLNFPVIIKPNKGLKGENISLINSKEDLHNIPNDYIIQEAITESFGKDIRLVIFKGTLLYSIKRENTKDFRSNKNQGGTITEFNPPKNLIKQAIKICETLDLGYAGVDFLISKNSYILCEINSFPGLTLPLKKVKLEDYSLLDRVCSKIFS